MRIFALALLLAALSVPTMAQEVKGQGRVQSSTRGVCRVLAIDTSDGKFEIPLQYQFTYGLPKWQAKYETQYAQLEMAKQSMRWRLGTNSWTTFDTNYDLTVGGVKVPAGIYYACIERAADGKASIVFLDPKKIHAKKLDAFQARTTTGGIKAPMTMKKVEKSQEELNISFTNADNPNKSTLVIAWGPRTLTADIKVITAK